MCNIKFNGLIQEIIENPDDIVEIIQNKLQLPLDKAEVLANRIKKQHLQTIHNTEQKKLSIVTEKHTDTNQQKNNLYNPENLSNKEFKTFTKWLLQELGYNIYPKEIPTTLGTDYIATNNNSKTAILTRKYPKNSEVSQTAILLAQQAKHIYQCEQTIILTTAMFSNQAKLAAEKYNVELWDAQKLNEKIMEIKKKADMEIQDDFPKYKDDLLNSLLTLGEDKKFLIEKRAGEKYDLFVHGIKFPLLTFYTQKDIVTKLTYRVKYNEPVGENDGETLIKCDKTGNCSGPEDAEAYVQVTEYLEQFLE